MWGKRTEGLLRKWVEFPPGTELGHKELIVRAKRWLQISADKRRKQHDNKTELINFKIGKLVLVKNH